MSTRRPSEPPPGSPAEAGDSTESSVEITSAMFEPEPAPSPADARARSLVGTTISGRYRIHELIAMGGMGAVYRGEHIHLRKRLAVKVLHPETENLPELVERFRREALVGAHARHPHVAAATDFGTLDDGSYFLALEHVKGVTLYDALRPGPMPPARAIHIVRQLAEALSAIHSRGIIHRDVKPQNVMLVNPAGGAPEGTSEGTSKGSDAPPGSRGPDFVKLIDFGLSMVDLSLLPSLEMSVPAPAQLADPPDAPDPPERLTMTGTVFGTVAYLAPEATLGMDNVDGRADLYALGIILYEMLTGRRPFIGKTPAELITQHVSAQPPSFAEAAPGRAISPALERITRRLLAKQPAERYQRGGDVIAALDEALRADALTPIVATSTAGVVPAAVDAPQAGEGPQAAAGTPDARGAAPPAPAGTPAPKPAVGALGTPPPLPAVSAAPSAPPAVARARAPASSMPASAPSALVPASALAPPLSDDSAPALAATALLATRPQSSAEPSSSDIVITPPPIGALRRASRGQAGPKPAGEASSRSRPRFGYLAALALPLCGLGLYFMFAGDEGPSATSEPPTASAYAPAPSPTPLDGNPDPGAAPGAAASVAAPASASASIPVASVSPTEADLERLRNQVRTAANKSYDYESGRKALAELASLDPPSLTKTNFSTAAIDVLTGVEESGKPGAAELFELLASERCAPHGLDLLYDVVQLRSGRKASRRASELLRKPELVARATPALQITFAFREADCAHKDGFAERIVADGDGRTLFLLKLSLAGCGRTQALDKAYNELLSKLMKK
jgi:eukaryotic-like serine/threonine-protein kinase